MKMRLINKELFYNKVFPLIKKIIRFYFVWWIALLWNLIITYIVTDTLKYDYNISLLWILIYNVTIIFYLQKNFTFKNKWKEEIKKQIIIYFIRLILILSAQKLFVPILNKYIPNYTLCTLIISWIITIINFLVQNFFIFNTTKKWQTNLSQSLSQHWTNEK